MHRRVRIHCQATVLSSIVHHSLLELLLDRGHGRHVVVYRLLLILIGLLQVLEQIVHHRVHRRVVVEAPSHLDRWRWLLRSLSECARGEIREVTTELVDVLALTLCDVRLLMGWLSVINGRMSILLCD